MNEMQAQVDTDFAQVMLEHDPVLAVLCDQNLVLCELNRAAERVLGVTKELAAGKPLAGLFESETLRTAIAKHYGELSTENPCIYFDHMLDERCFSNHLQLVLLDGPPMITWRQREITEENLNRKRLQQGTKFQELIGAIAAEFVNFAVEDFDIKATKALQLLGEFTGADRASIYLFDDTSEQLDETHQWNSPDMQGVRPCESPTPLLKRLDDSPLALNSLDELPPEADKERGYLEREGIKSIMLAPLSLQGREFGYISFITLRQEKKWPPSYGPLLRLLGEVVVAALLSKGTDQALRSSESKFRSLVQFVPFTISIIRHETVLFANRACLKMFGYESAGDVVGTSIFSHVSEQEIARIRNYLENRQTSNGMGSGTHPVMLCRTDGTEFPAQVYLSPTEFDGKRATQAVVVDFTEQRRHEDDLRSALKYQSVLNQILRAALLPDTSLDRLLDENLSLLATVPWLDDEFRAFLYLVENDPGVLILKGSYNVAPEMILQRSTISFGEGPCGRAAQTENVVFMKHDMEAKECGIVGYDSVHIPLIASGKVIGTLAVWVSAGTGLEAARLDFLEALGNTLAVVIHRRQAEERLRAGEARMRAVLDNVIDGIITVDHNGKLESCNPAAGLILQYPEGALIGMPLESLIPEAGKYEGPAFFLRDHEGQGAKELVALNREGDDFPIEMSISEMKLGRRHLFVAILRDITERKRVEKELIRTKEEAEEANKSKTLFLATMSHELRTPLNSIIGFTKIILKDADSHLTDKESNFLERVLTNGRQLLDLINDLLDLSKVEAGKMDTVDSMIALRAFLQDILEHHRPCLHRGVELRCEFPAAMLPIKSDPDRLRQIMNNLISNAIKFTERGYVCVRVETNSDQQAIAIKVIDTGIGIPVELHDKIFEAFVQADSGSSRKYQGTGLGLKICHRLCGLLGYELTLDSESGRGSVFTVHLRPKRIQVPSPYIS